MTVFRAKARDVEVEGLAGLKRAGDSLEDHAAPDDVPQLEICGCSQEPYGFFEVADKPDVFSFRQLMRERPRSKSSSCRIQFQRGSVFVRQ